MKRLRFLHLVTIAAAFAGNDVFAQGKTNVPVSSANDVAPVETKETEEQSWAFSAAATTYVVPDFQEYVQPTFTADRNWLHLEARYNYENLATASVWMGYNFGGGEKLAWEFTPMLGGVFGDTTGIAPGCKLSASYGKVDFFSEGELVFETGNSEGSFFYNWSELSVSPVHWFRIGLAGQRTRVYQTKVDVQRGILAGFTYKEMDFTAYVLNPDKGKPTWIFAVLLNF